MPSISVVQAAHVVTGTGATSGTGTWTGNVTKGNTLIVAVFISTNASTTALIEMTSISDTLGNTYQILTTAIPFNATTGCAWLFLVPSNISTGANTVTAVITTATGGHIDIVTWEYSFGTGYIPAIDQCTTATATAVSTTATTPSVFISFPNELVIGLLTGAGTFASIEAGWTGAVTADNFVYETLITTVAGSHAATATQTSGLYVGIIVSLYSVPNVVPGQVYIAQSNTSTLVATCVFPAIQTAGNSNVVMVVGNSANPTAMIDSVNGGYSLVWSTSVGAVSVTYWLLNNIKSATAGSNTVTSIGLAAASILDFFIIEVGAFGYALGPSVNGHATAASGAPTLTLAGVPANSIILSLLSNGGYTNNAGMSVTTLNALNDIDGYNMVVTAGSQVIQYGTASSTTWTEFAMAFTVLSPASTITVVQAAHVVTGTGATSGTGTWSGNVTQGNALFAAVIVATNSTTTALIEITSISDTLGNTYNLATSNIPFNAATGSAWLFYVPSNISSGANTVTVVLTTSTGGHIDIVTWEYGFGTGFVAALDQCSSVITSVAATNAPTPLIATVYYNEILIDIQCGSGTFSQIPSGWTGGITADNFVYATLVAPAPQGQPYQGDAVQTSGTSTALIGSFYAAPVVYPGPIYLAQANQSGAGIATCKYPAKQTQGNNNIVVVLGNNTSPTVVADTTNGAYTLAWSTTVSTSAFTYWLFNNIASAGAGANTVTPSGIAAGSIIDIFVIEIGAYGFPLGSSVNTTATAASGAPTLTLAGVPVNSIVISMLSNSGFTSAPFGLVPLTSLNDIDGYTLALKGGSQVIQYGSASSATWVEVAMAFNVLATGIWDSLATVWDDGRACWDSFLYAGGTSGTAAIETWDSPDTLWGDPNAYWDADEGGVNDSNFTLWNDPNQVWDATAALVNFFITTTYLPGTSLIFTPLLTQPTTLPVISDVVMSFTPLVTQPTTLPVISDIVMAFTPLLTQPTTLPAVSDVVMSFTPLLTQPTTLPVISDFVLAFTPLLTQPTTSSVVSDVVLSMTPLLQLITSMDNEPGSVLSFSPVLNMLDTLPLANDVLISMLSGVLRYTTFPVSSTVLISLLSLLSIPSSLSYVSGSVLSFLPIKTGPVVVVGVTAREFVTDNLGATYTLGPFSGAVDGINLPLYD